MKKGILLLLLISCSLFVRAQQDSILVVIECDSLYRPFKNELGYLFVDFNTNDYNVSRDFELKMGDRNGFKIPIPTDSNGLYNLSIEFSNGCGIYLSGKDIYLGPKSWHDYSYSAQWELIRSDEIEYGEVRTIKFSFPVECENNKYLINNTCPICAKQDSISWMLPGSPVEDPPPGTILPEIYNPYNNPIKLKSVYGGGIRECQLHWYCHRCKKEY